MAADFLVHRHQARSRVDHEQRDCRAGQCRLGLRAHPPRQGCDILVFPPGGVDDGKFQPQQLGIAQAAIAGHPGLIVDEREFFTHQPVEQGGFADVGSADDHDMR